MPFPILRSRVGYFDDMDRGAAAGLIEVLEPLSDLTRGPLALRDYGALDLAPGSGRLDLWIGG